MSEIFFHTGIIDDNMGSSKSTKKSSAVRAKNRAKFIVGIDEVGRGPLAGPVSVCAVMIPEDNYKKLRQDGSFKGLHNSKALSESARNNWDKKIRQWQREGLLDFKYVSMSAKQIDRKGIAVCIRECLKKSLERLDAPLISKILMDGGLVAPDKFKDQKSITKGDEKEPIISFASIVAKVRRDKYMNVLAQRFPKYSLNENKGYGTLEHRKAIKKFGASEIHRQTFCRNIINKK
jgi:ribonuclease HII